MPLRIKEPISIRKLGESLSIRDAAGTVLAYLYETEPTRRANIACYQSSRRMRQFRTYG